ncbi:EVE domain-containing protein, partial [Klebsiella pneumoniae]|uniref:EVE domain-containing protein n=1 Tax=Klebsiella pneumoniae TaxID=573 RepID=UPI00300B6F73
VAVDFKPHKKLKKPVTLVQIKADKRLANMALVRLGRLSVQPVTVLTGINSISLRRSARSSVFCEKSW